MNTFNQMKYLQRKACMLMLLGHIFVLLSCGGDADLNVPPKGEGIPLTVTVTDIENTSGASMIRYKLPNDKNISYVEAVYYVDNREVRKKGSFYTDYLVLDGFREAKEHDVALYSVSFSEVRSEPVSVKVSPETPPYQDVAQTLEVRPTFGGVWTTYTNPTKANLEITFLEKNVNGEWQEVETTYTSLQGGRFAVRNLENREYVFGVTCRDRWQHTSDTIEIRATPWYEELADITKFANHALPGDVTRDLSTPWHTGAGAGVGNIHALWNGQTAQPFTAVSPYFFFQNTGYGLPSSITIDLGERYLLSRFVYWPRQIRNNPANPSAHTFAATHVKTFELWGSNNPNPDGSWGSWTLIGYFESFRPSGNTTPGDQYSTAEDRLVTSNGESYDMPEEIDSYRYIRYKVFSTWGPQPYWASVQLQFYGVKDN